MTASPCTNLPVGTPSSQKQSIDAASRLTSPSPAAGSSTTTAGTTQPTAAAVAVVAAAAMTVEEIEELPSAEETRSSSQPSVPVPDPAFRQSRCVFVKDPIMRRSVAGRSSTPPPEAQRPTLERRQSLSAPASRAASPVRGNLEINKRTVIRRKQRQQQRESTVIVRSLSPPPPPTPPPSRSQSPFTPKSLVVDDNSITGEILSRILRKDFGHSVTCVVSGEDALEKLASDVFNMCFLDIDMPGINGIETTLVIRRKGSMVSDTSDAEDPNDVEDADGAEDPNESEGANKGEDTNEDDRDSKGNNCIVHAASTHVLDENRDIPIIAYTTNTCVERYFEAGMNGFITKPPSRTTLKNELDRIL